MQNLFGTDGIRGEYGLEITADTAYRLGASLGKGLTVIGRDTRLSGELLQNALCEGIQSAGGKAVCIGILPTNAVAFFTRRLGAEYGVMVSASHNPPKDNGLKVFDKYGFKLCATKQVELSRKMSENGGYIGNVKCSVWSEAAKIYCDELLSIANFEKIEITLDCGNGAAFSVAPKLFVKCGAKLRVINNTCDGSRINVDCGALYPSCLGETAKRSLAFAYDGDADRLAVLENGCVLDNNRVFYALAKFYEENKMLSRGMVAGTELTNVGVERALERIGLKLARSEVGDARLAELMAKKGINLGGEESGHYLLFDYASSSDAIINSLMLANVYSRVGSLIEYTKELKLVNTIKFDFALSPDRKCALIKNKFPQTAAVKLKAEFPMARIVVRFSGTEQKLRFFVETDEKGEEIREKAEKLFNSCC